MSINNQWDDIASQTRSIRDVVYEKLKSAILLGQYQSGYHLKERVLAGELQISTTPIKEALRRLEQEGLVRTSARRGCFVADDIMNSVEEINWARSALEGVAARLAAIKITDEEAIQLTAIIDKMHIATRDKAAEQLLVLNEGFHKHIQAIAKNNYIYQQIEAIRSFDRSFRIKALSHQDELERAYEEHKRIYDQIIKRDADGSEQAMITHIRRTILFLKKERGEYLCLHNSSKT